jgi:nitrate reductase NapE
LRWKNGAAAQGPKCAADQHAQPAAGAVRCSCGQVGVLGGEAMSTTASDTGSPDQAPERRRELLVFLFLTVVLAPVLAVAIVGGYGFLIWISQMIYGPPGPPAV